MRQRAIVLVLVLCQVACEGEPAREERVPDGLIRQRSQALSQQVLSEHLAHDRANLELVPRDDGARQYHVRSGFRHVTVLTRGSDAGVSHACINDLRQLDALEPKGGR